MHHAHRHSRAHVRHHFVRVALNRRRTYLATHDASSGAREQFDLALGRFDKGQPYLGCRRPRCGICHPSKRWHSGADRLAAEHSWRNDWAEHLI
jgi:hypothetical protein